MKIKQNISANVKAFTLMELAVGMLLTTVTAAAGFSLYLFFIKTIKKHTSDEELVKNVQFYYFRMENDLKSASEILPLENGIILITKENNKIIYRIEDTLLLREIPGVNIDTVRLNSSLLIAENGSGEKPVTDFSITQLLNKKEITWSWKKEYSPGEKINQYILENVH